MTNATTTPAVSYLGPCPTWPDWPEGQERAMRATLRHGDDRTERIEIRHADWPEATNIEAYRLLGARMRLAGLWDRDRAHWCRATHALLLLTPGTTASAEAERLETAVNATKPPRVPVPYVEPYMQPCGRHNRYDVCTCGT